MATNKKKGQKPETPIPAAIWFEHQDRLPTEAAGPQTKKTRPVLSATNRMADAIPAAIWFENYTQLPSQLGDDSATVERKTKDQPKKNPTPSVSLPKSVPTVQLSKDAHIDELITSILSLTNTIKEEHSKRIQDEQIGQSDERKYNSFKDLLKSIVSDKTSQAKNALSVRNLMLTAGVRSAFSGSDTIIDRLLSYAENKPKGKGKDKGQATKPSLLGSVVFGTADYARKKVSGALSPITDSKIIGKATDILSTVKATLTPPKIKLPSPIEKISTASKLEAINNPDTLWGSISRRYYPEISKNPELETARILTKPSSKAEREFTSEVRSGMKDELTSLSEKQLEQLKKIVGALSGQNKETKLESVDALPTPISSQKKEEKEVREATPEKSIISTLLNGFDGLKSTISTAIQTIGPILTSALGPLMRVAGPALAVAGAGAAGYAAGTWLNDKVINPGMSKILGKDATLGTAIYDAVDGVAGWFSESDADKMNRASGKTQSSSGKIVDMTSSKYREAQTSAVKGKIAEISAAKTEKVAHTNIVDNRTTVSSTSTTVQYIRPPIKSNDATFNSLLNKNFAH